MSKVFGAFGLEEKYMKGVDGKLKEMQCWAVGWLVNDELGKDVEGVLVVLLWQCHYLPGGTEENHQISLVGVFPIWTWHPLSTSAEQHLMQNQSPHTYILLID